MSIKRKKNYDKAQHIEEQLSFLSLDEGKVVQPCSPPAHEDEEMVILSHIDGLMKEPFDMVDEHIYNFI
jgi:hypothetical protein